MQPGAPPRTPAAGTWGWLSRGTGEESEVQRGPRPEGNGEGFEAAPGRCKAQAARSLAGNQTSAKSQTPHGRTLGEVPPTVPSKGQSGASRLCEVPRERVLLPSPSRHCGAAPTAPQGPGAPQTPGLRSAALWRRWRHGLWVVRRLPGFSCLCASSLGRPARWATPRCLDTWPHSGGASGPGAEAVRSLPFFSTVDEPEAVRQAAGRHGGLRPAAAVEALIPGTRAS